VKDVCPIRFGLVFIRARLYSTQVQRRSQ
jgi:hypothetical protein